MSQYLTDEDYEVAEANGIHRKLLYNRFYMWGWSKERSVSQKPVHHPVMKGYIQKWKPVIEQTGITVALFYARVRAKGWDPERAATTPRMGPEEKKELSRAVQHKNAKITQEVIETAEKNGISKGTLSIRVYQYKWPVERAMTEPVHKNFRRKDLG